MLNINVRYWVISFIFSLNPINPLRQALFEFCRWGHWSSKRLSNLSEVIQMWRSRAEIWTQLKVSAKLMFLTSCYTTHSITSVGLHLLLYQFSQDVIKWYLNGNFFDVSESQNFTYSLQEFIQQVKILSMPLSFLLFSFFK